MTKEPFAKNRPYAPQSLYGKTKQNLSTFYAIYPQAKLINS